MKMEPRFSPGFMAGVNWEEKPKRGPIMNKALIALICGMTLMAVSTTVRSHDVVDSNGRPSNTHKHVWRQQSYGRDYRQGHSVNGSRGSITTWSPSTYRGYNAGSSVRFARPVPLSQRPKAGENIPNVKSGGGYGSASRRQ